MNLSTKQAMGILEKALAKAEEIGVFVNIAVLDTGGHMKGFVRMDRAFIACIDIAKGKNFYALRLPSHRIGKF
ncbi:GlcG/HbpS family heme-binding protein [Chryseobacterium wanjuense]